MLNDMAWRKAPRDILTNPKIRAIARKFPVTLRPAVFAFYMAFYMQADDDGIVDLSEKDVYAELLMLEDEEIIDELIIKFLEKGYLEEMSSGKYYIIDWDNPNQATYIGSKRVAETADQRRARVFNAIENAPKKKRQVSKKHQDSTINIEENEDLPCYSEILETINAAEKKSSEKMHDKNAENVATVQREERIEKPEIRDEKKDTHIESAEKEPSQPEQASETEKDTEVPLTAPSAVAEKKELTAEKPLTVNSEKERENTHWCYEDTKKAISQMNLPDSFADKLKLKSWDEWQALNVIYAYFHDKAVPFWENKPSEINAMKIIVKSCKQMAEPKNAPYVIAGQLVRLFGELIANKGIFAKKEYEYFLGFPVMPSSMLKPSVWPRIVEAARRVLKPGLRSNPKWLEMQENEEIYRRDVEEERASYNNSSPLDLELQEAGYDPSKASNLTQYLAKLAAEKDSKT